MRHSREQLVLVPVIKVDTSVITRIVNYLWDQQGSSLPFLNFRRGKRGERLQRRLFLPKMSRDALASKHAMTRFRIVPVRTLKFFRGLRKARIDGVPRRSEALLG